MYNEPAPEFVVDQGVSYPTTTNYGYYCTGFEAPGDWDDHHVIFGLDGPDFQYPGAQSESLPYVYYTPSHGYAQSPYNPYNPYIPGAVMGFDGSIVGAQQYYAMPTYESPASPPAYIPVVVQPDVFPNSLPDPLFDHGALIANRPDGGGINHNLASASAPFNWNPPKYTPNQSQSWTKVSEELRTNTGPSKQPVINRSALAGSFTGPATLHAQKGRSASGSIQVIDDISSGKVMSHHNQLKVALPVSNGPSEFRQGLQGPPVDKLRPVIHFGRASNEIQDSVGEQNRGPRTSRLKNQLAVKAYRTNAGDGNSQGNIIINTDQYNKEDFPVEYPGAKFFVIKSYSEDDVHRSIKYNVWSSTPHGNKKLDIAYNDALRISAGKHRGCPIFLFFSVNASGQFCGVAEMIGPVDFHKDMDFWQQDKWNGCFPVQWHIIKDVPNTNFRHIILENNENKPVTNSRDTQEIMYKQGLEMLKIFKNHTMKTSLFDDFMYYENRQKIMQDEKARPLRSLASPFFAPTLDAHNNGGGPVELLRMEIEKPNNHGPTSEQGTSSGVIEANAMERNNISVLSKKIRSLSINTNQVEAKLLAKSVNAAAQISGHQSDPPEVVKVGSMAIKVNTYSESSPFLTVGTIPLDPKALKNEKGGSFGKNAPGN